MNYRKNIGAGMNEVENEELDTSYIYKDEQNIFEASLDVEGDKINKKKKVDSNYDSIVQLNASVLKKMRQIRGYTLQDLSSLSGLSTSYISRLEAGERRMNTEILHRLALALGCDPEIFFQKQFKPEVVLENGFSKDVPLYRVITAGASVNERPYDVIFMNDPMLRMFRLPHFAANESIFVIYGVNDDYVPRFKSGDYLYFKVCDCHLDDFVMIINQDNCIIMGSVLKIDSSSVTLDVKGERENHLYSSMRQMNVLVAVVYR